MRFALERFLYRLSKSPHEHEFVLKGAMLFAIWSSHPHRATKDLDLLGSGTPDPERLSSVFRDVCAVAVEDDGVTFDSATVVATRIKEDAEFEGVRVKLDGKLGSAKLAVQVDVGFGDTVIPPPTIMQFPTLLPLPAPVVRVYARETVIAEKLHAMVDLGMANTRLKDFFDLWFLSQKFGFRGEPLASAVRATFEQRQTAILLDPVALTDTFAFDGPKQTQWHAFLSRSRVTDKTVGLDRVVAEIALFLGPVLRAAGGVAPTPSTWVAGGPWK